jgi:ABC-2 type transport system ATP-binding protein
MLHVEAQGLCKTFRVAEREGGLRAALGALLRRRQKDVRAVDQVSFRIEEGEMVGFLGPNGAGKTTTLKMLSGLLHPSGGTATVLGHVPWRRDTRFLRQIALLMGNRSQLLWDLPALDSFQVQLAVYGVDRRVGAARRDELVELLDLGPIVSKPVRTLSLGERMKCEMCMALLHGPRVLFLDEPTLGVDITMQTRIRQFVAEYNRRHRATVILTSHYMADVTALCRRIIVIHHGRLLFDGPLTDLVERLAPFKVVTIDLDRDLDGYEFSGLGEVVSRDARKVSLRVPRDRTPYVAGRLLADLPVLDLTIQDPPIEDVIQHVFAASASPAPVGEPRERPRAEPTPTVEASRAGPG